MGHASITTTARSYAHLYDDELDTAADPERPEEAEGRIPAPGRCAQSVPMTGAR